MRIHLIGGVAALLAALPADLLASGAAPAAQPPVATAPELPPYRRPANPSEPAAQLAEMLNLYDSVCLKAFPDDGAVARAVIERQGVALSAAQMRRYLHEDPGVGWRVAGRTASFDVTIEAPPFHACGIRTLTVAGFPDLAPYRALADRFEQGGGYRAVAPMDAVVGSVRSVGGGEVRQTPGGGEALFNLSTTPVHPAAGDDAVEVRFVHQVMTPSTAAAPAKSQT